MLTLELGPIIRASRRRRASFLLVVLEFACSFTIISCLLVSGAWYRRVGNVHMGPHEDDLLEVTVQRPGRAGPQGWQGAVVPALLAEPGVVAAAPVSTTLLDEGAAAPVLFHAGGSAAGAAGWTVQAGLALPAVLGMQLLEGRFPASPGEVLITRCLRQALFPGGRPALGQPLVGGDLPRGTVIGVVEDLSMRRPFFGGAGCEAFHFVPLANPRGGRYLVRVAPGRREAVAAALPVRLAPLVRDGLAEVAPVTLASSRQYVVAHGVTLMLVMLGLNVMLVAMLGPIAVTSFLVRERTRQIGVRRALGATRPAIVRHFLVETSLAVALGTALGALATAAMVTLMRRAFYSISISSWLLALTAVLLWIDGTLAALFPALRASRIPPSVAARTG
jgi:putative ABC transport system permease protein